MKKKSFLSAALAFCMAATLSISAIGCGKKSYTVTYHNDDGTEIGKIVVNEGDTIPDGPSGWFLGSDLYKSLSDYNTTVDDDADNDADPIDKKAGATADMSVWGYYIKQELSGGDGYTYTYALSDFPTVWNPFTYQTATDDEILSYVTDSFYTFDYNDAKDGYKMIDAMAVGDPVDVTSDYVGDAWGITADDEHRAWKITIRDDLKWDDGTAITAQTFVTSMKLLLDPAAQNSRADDYTYAGDFVVHNAKNYLYQGQEVIVSSRTKYEEWDKAKVDSKIVFDVMSDNTGFGAYGNKQGYKTSYYDSTYGWAKLLVAFGCEASMVEIHALQDKTFAEISASETLSATWEKVIKIWQSEPNEELDFFGYYEPMPEVSFEDVGIKAVSDTEIVYILDQELKGFYLKYALPGSCLVKEDVYKACASTNGGVYTNTYGTNASNTPSFGPYKLTSFQRDKAYKLEKNTNWYGIVDAAKNTDENAPTLYQTTAIKVLRVANASTRLQMFLAGQLDSYGLTVNDMEDYQMSDNTYYTTGASTFFVAMNPNKEALEAKQAAAGENKNKTILTIKEFRQALSFSLNRSAFALATAPTNGPAYAAFSSLIVCNPETGDTYRATEEAKDAVLAFWGLTNDVGEGKRYATKDEAIESITGYDLTGAKALFNTAYEKAIEAGLMDADDVVEIKIGLPNGTSTFYVNGYEFLVNCWTEAVKGTKLEGKLTFTKDDTLGNAFGDRLRDNSVDLLFGVGFTGSALNPYGLVSVYSGNEESIRYDPSFNTTLVDVTVDLTGLEEGKSGTYTASMDDWTNFLSGATINVKKADGTLVENVKVDSENYSIKTPVLAAIEKAMLEQYDMIPLIDDASASLKGKKYNYYTEDYVFGVGRGGVKYMTYNYTDSEWAAYVKAQGGKLNYK